jgi:hypothetical protein
VRPTADAAHATVSFKVHAAGTVDEVSVYERSSAAARSLDLACVVDTMRALRFPDRGHEPGTRVVALIAATANGAPPDAIVPNDAADALELFRDDVRACRDRELVRAPQLAGTVIVRMTTDRDGWVVDARADEGSLAHDRVRTCIAEKVRRVRFVSSAGAAPAGQRAVSWLFTFPVVERRRPTGLRAPTLFACLGIG